MDQIGLSNAIKALFATLGKKTSNTTNGGVPLLNTQTGEPNGMMEMKHLAVALGVNRRERFVDMGLPSGTLWDSRNLGAECPEDYGYYFSWGNVVGHKATADGSSNIGFAGGYNFGSDNEGPYASTPGASLTGNITDDHDAAQRYLGGMCKMPTKEQFVELFNTTYIKYIDASGTDISSQEDKRTTLNGVVGLYIESKVNGNRLFFPAAGYGSGTTRFTGGSYGSFWSRSLQSSTNGYHLYFNASGVTPQNDNLRFYGFSVRAVL